ncbi:hypothetical protein J8J14_13795 [Roseomonas sp. SSH11]|uniref:Phage tail sheath protein n=1 Tax=Pararoseomonas baculiformis TaxID=2820812 RepID=A0ABS4AFS5_9PROT|nr:hypothetical protein [Pararoseomonas baculiformis]MBP0445848.1 hypothetical protein [Pararoseomonas baculiformis]
MATLIVPGVQVQARFDIVPPLPAASGIVGVVGLVDRAPADGALVGVTRTSELREILGPGTEASMPEAVHALANGAAEVVVSAVPGGARAQTELRNPDGAVCVRLVCRAAGAWGNELRADLQAVTGADNAPVRVTLRLLRGGRVAETFSDLRVAPGQPDDLFETINRNSRHVVALDPGFGAGTLPADGTFAFAADGAPLPVKEAAGARDLLQLLPGDGVDPSGLSVQITATGPRIGLRVSQRGLQESYAGLSMDPDDERYLPDVLLREGRLVRARILPSLPAEARLPRGTDAPQDFSGGSSPGVADYATAIDRLEDDPRIDLVLASVEAARPGPEVAGIHQALLAHAVRMADAAAPRIAFGAVTPAEQGSPDAIRAHAAAVRGRRFVLVSPSGAAGAVAGAIGRLSPEIAPTFKPLPLFDIAPARYRESELNRLLGPGTNLFVVQDRIGVGVVALKGIDTTGDQISVTRVADSAIRETKATAERFIGTTNTDEARTALRQQLVATFTRMERAGWLVPSTDGTDPAFLVDVYSTQQDFGQGIVRVDVAVRPVRAIDYVYATIRVKV